MVASVSMAFVLVFCTILLFHFVQQSRFTTATQFDHFHAVKQDVMLKIMDIVASHGAEFAFPTQTLYMAGADSADTTVPAPAPEHASVPASMPAGRS